MSHTGFLVAGYGVTLAGIFAYLWRLRRLERELERRETGGTPE